MNRSLHDSRCPHAHQRLSISIYQRCDRHLHSSFYSRTCMFMYAPDVSRLMHNLLHITALSLMTSMVHIVIEIGLLAAWRGWLSRIRQRGTELKIAAARRCSGIVHLQRHTHEQLLNARTVVEIDGGTARLSIGGLFPALD
jgi:hypothetical protein